MVIVYPLTSYFLLLTSEILSYRPQRYDKKLENEKMKGEKVGKRKTKREKVKKALPALPLNGSLGGGFLSSEWAVAHARSGCERPL